MMYRPPVPLTLTSSARFSFSTKSEKLEPP